MAQCIEKSIRIIKLFSKISSKFFFV